MDNFDVVIVPIIVGLMEVVKKFDIDKRFIPVASLIIGLAFSLLKNGFKVESVIAGLGYGLSACGLYSGTKNTFQK